eukprot:scaffold78477_cov66-Phaeocystis_antarctica.AAC.3
MSPCNAPCNAARDAARSAPWARATREAQSAAAVSAPVLGQTWRRRQAAAAAGGAGPRAASSCEARRSAAWRGAIAAAAALSYCGTWRREARRRPGQHRVAAWVHRVAASGTSGYRCSSSTVSLQHASDMSRAPARRPLSECLVSSSRRPCLRAAQGGGGL